MVSVREGAKGVIADYNAAMRAAVILMSETWPLFAPGPSALRLKAVNAR
jgi:hypothetical protein